MDGLDDLLAGATAGIAPGYFQLSIDGGPSVYRERVYCYELYHQMRLGWPKDGPFVLNGEVDKAGHGLLRELGVGAFKPDFLVHVPGSMDGNHAVIEVKPEGEVFAKADKDLNTLSIFLTRARYARGIYLVYGHNIHDDHIQHILAVDAKMEVRAPIELWLHRAPGEPARLERVLGETKRSVLRHRLTRAKT
ncbi:MAG: methionyl-tRNA formyltransferase-like protein [Bradyrhizobium sp.]